jgi:hypothetical protein
MKKPGRKSRQELEFNASFPNATAANPDPTPTDLPPPPADLSSSTKEWWRQMTSDYAFLPHQLHILRTAGEALDRYQEARRILAREGLSYEDPKGMLRPRPEAAIERDARIAYIRCLRELKFDAAEPSGDRRFSNCTGVTWEQLDLDQ